MDGEWDVDELVAHAGLGSRAYELDINFDVNLGKLEDRRSADQHRHSQLSSRYRHQSLT